MRRLRVVGCGTSMCDDDCDETTTATAAQGLASVTISAQLSAQRTLRGRCIALRFSFSTRPAQRGEIQCTGKKLGPCADSMSPHADIGHLLRKMRTHITSIGRRWAWMAYAFQLSVENLQVEGDNSKCVGLGWSVVGLALCDDSDLPTTARPFMAWSP